MTLNTLVYIRDPVDVMTVFAKCRELLGATADSEARFYFWKPDDWSSTDQSPRDGVWSVGHSPGQGLPALLDIEFRPGTPLRTAEQSFAHDDCEDGCDGLRHPPPCWCEVSFDTAYGYEGDKGQNCGQLHVELLVALGQWLDQQCVLWSWRNEFTGEVFDRYDGLDALGGEGDSARRWFTETVAPVINAMVQ